jgi:hypothetical protein
MESILINKYNMKKLFTILAILSTGVVFAQQLTLKSKVDLVYNVKGTMNKKDTTKIKGRIQGVYWSNNCEKIGVDYSYLTDDGNIIETNAYTAEGLEIQAIYDIIKNDIPKNLSRSKTEDYEMYLGFRWVMAKTFGINVSDIEIITE